MQVFKDKYDDILKQHGWGGGGEKLPKNWQEHEGICQEQHMHDHGVKAKHYASLLHTQAPHVTPPANPRKLCANPHCC